MSPRLVVFDMGGVLVELGPLNELLELPVSAETFWPRWLASDTVRNFERGACSVEDFGAGLVEEFSLDIDPAALIDNFSRFPRGLYPGAAALVAAAGARAETAILSNTNALHWDHQPDGAVIRAMADRQYLSYRLGLLKPDPAIFRHVIDDSGLAADDILFLDDNQINVDGARAVGLRAERTFGVDEAKAALVTYGVLDAA